MDKSTTHFVLISKYYTYVCPDINFIGAIKNEIKTISKDKDHG